jgi:hypothetical protein
MPSPMSEDQLFKALLKKKPEAQVPVKKEPVKTVPAAQPVEVYKEKEPVIETPPVKPLETELIVGEIRNLTSSVNMMYGLIKTVMVPVLVLILIVGIAILMRTK